MSKSQSPIDQFVELCCQDKEILSFNTCKQVFNYINTALQDHYKGRANQQYIEGIADDVTESVCLRLNISDK